MGYCIKKLSKKKSEPKWKVQYTSRKKEDAINKDVKFPSRSWDIPKSRWSGLGVRKGMRIEEAKERCSQLNAQATLKRNEELRIKYQEKLKQEDLKARAYLPQIYKDEFEQRYFYDRDREKIKKNKNLVHWRSAQKLMLDLRIDPSDWYDEVFQIYDWFVTRKYSPAYVKQILNSLNNWGYFLCKKLDKPFLPIPSPRGFERARLIDAYYSKNEKGKASAPTTPEHLESAKENFVEDQYNWLYLSVWFGLRPKEVDNLKENSKIMKDEADNYILWVYQTKIVSAPPMMRWKPIPIILPEQKVGLKIIKEQSFSRPLVKTVRRYIGRNHTLYGGRKGFTDLMISKKQSLENISQWLGHSTIERTWKHYKNKLAVHYDEVA